MESTLKYQRRLRGMCIALDIGEGLLKIKLNIFSIVLYDLQKW